MQELLTELLKVLTQYAESHVVRDKARELLGEIVDDVDAALGLDRGESAPSDANASVRGDGNEPV